MSSTTVVINIEFDPDLWNKEYGTDQSVNEIREEIKQAAFDAVTTGAFGHLTAKRGTYDGRSVISAIRRFYR